MATHSSILAWETPWTEEAGITGYSGGGYSPGGCKESDTTEALSTPMNCSLPGSSVHGVSQARILEWVAISFYRLQSTGYCLWGHRVGLDLVIDIIFHLFPLKQLNQNRYF